MQSLGVVWCLAIISSTRVMANPASHVVDNARLESREARESIIILAEEDISNPEPESYVTMKPTSNIYDYDLQEAEQAEIDRFLQHFYQAPANEDTSEDTNFNTDQYGDEAYDSYLDQDNQGGEGSRFSSKLHPDNYYFVNKDNYLKYIHELERQNRRREEDARNDNILEEIEDDESPLMGRFRREASNLYDTIKSKSVINKGLNKNGVASYDHADCRGRSGGSGGGGGIPGGNGRVPGGSGGVPGGNSGGAGGAGGNGVDVDGAGEDGGAGGVDEGGVDAGGDVEGVEGDDGTETNELRQRLVNRINRRRVSRQRRRGFKTSDEELQ